MKLNNLEYWLMNTPFRRAIQRWREFPLLIHLLKKHAISLEGASLLDIGCGPGYDASLLSKSFKPKRLVGLDYMPEQIALAKTKPIDAEWIVGDTTNLPFAEKQFDAVFCFGVLHHIPAWKQAIQEVARVLSKGGIFYLEEFHGKAVSFYTKIGFYHDPEAAFTWSELTQCLKEEGFTILDSATIVPFSGCKAFLAQKK